jgi:hypothetical protein
MTALGYSFDTTPLGVIIVPPRYNQYTFIADFYRRHMVERERQTFGLFNKCLKDTAFTEPSLVLKPGDKLMISVVNPSLGSRDVPPDERFAHLQSLGGVFPSAQGLLLAFDHFKDCLRQDATYVAFDQRDRLPRSVLGALLPCLKTGAIELDQPELGFTEFDGCSASSMLMLLFQLVK